MKKILALALTGLLVISGAGMSVSASASVDNTADFQTQATANNFYLVPGVYISDGEKVENSVPQGATKLSGDECAAIFTENAYLCTLSAGEALPVPVSTRQDVNGNAYAFNGWWTIVDATVTYFDKMPDTAEITFLYADWRADLSQRKDPVEPGDSTTLKPAHYMSVYRAATQETEILTLRVSGTDIPDAETLGYGAPVQLYNGWFELNPGDTITVYASGLGDSSGAQFVPVAGSSNPITLESNGDGSNNTASFITASTTENPVLTYRKALKKRSFRIYIKFFSKGTKMSVYMEPMN